MKESIDGCNGFLSEGVICSVDVGKRQLQVRREQERGSFSIIYSSIYSFNNTKHLLYVTIHIGNYNSNVRSRENLN